jgi:predicted N-acetyltransferase YhbS
VEVYGQGEGRNAYQGNYIGRLYVLPKHQGKGYGSVLMEELEKILSASYATALLEASLPSYDYYLRRGYRPKEYMKYEVENSRILCYYIMEKSLRPKENTF